MPLTVARLLHSLRTVEPIRHLATAASSDAWFLTAEFEHRVSLWSTATRSLEATFDTVLDFGGRRLALAGTDPDPIVVAGTWYRHGICAYRADGELLWQRKDLKRPQTIAPAWGGAMVAAGFDDRPLHVLDAGSGETVAKVRAVRDYAGSVAGGIGVGDLTQEVGLIDAEHWKVRWRAPISGFATLAAAVSDDEALVSVGGEFMSPTPDTYVVALDLAGKERWRWPCPAETNVQALAWDAEREVWLGFHSAGVPALLRWSPDGQLLDELRLAEAVEYEFLPGGQRLIASDGAVYDTQDASVAWRYFDE